MQDRPGVENGTIMNMPICHCMEMLPPQMWSVVSPFSSFAWMSDVPTCDLQLRRRWVEIERSLLRGEFMRMGNCYAELPRNSHCFLLAARFVLMGAIGSGDMALFAQTLEDVRTFPTRCDVPLAQLGAELTEAWLRQYLHVPGGYPDWLIEGNWEHVPQEWRLGVVLLLAKIHLMRRNYVQALATANTALFLISAKDFPPLGILELKLVAALSLQGLGRTEESETCFRDLVDVILKEHILIPLLELPMGINSPLCRKLKMAAPMLLQRVKSLSSGYFRNLVRFHNLLSEERLTDVLSPREFYVASSMLHGLRYKEIAERLGVAVSSVNGVTKLIYSKLDIHGSSQLVGKVW